MLALAMRDLPLYAWLTRASSSYGPTWRKHSINVARNLGGVPSCGWLAVEAGLCLPPGGGGTVSVSALDFELFFAPSR